MQEALHISPVQWGWVTGVFTLSYAAFEIPGGALGDRIGPRRVLTRIVLWWSAFTTLTGVVASFPLLLLVRFCFGMGEAGAYPNIGIVISRWFPEHKRSGPYGLVLMAAQIGGALAPFLVVPIQANFGWRASFYVFGILGIAWAVVWYWWFRDWPTETAHVKEPPKLAHHGLPWSIAIRSTNLWSVVVMAACAGYSLYFFQSWLGTYLVKARGFTETGLLLSSLPFLVGAAANTLGGFLGDVLVRKFGKTWGRRSIGFIGYGGAAVFVALAMFTHSQTLSLLMLSLTYGGLTLAQPALMCTCIDIGGKYAGSVTGAMQSGAYTAAFISSVAYGYLVERFGYDAPFLPMAVLMTVSALLWLKVDASRQVGEA
ncbi:MAG: MFS transporter [Acidobacteriota bacterium]